MEFTYTGKVSRAIGIIYTISSFALIIHPCGHFMIALSVHTYSTA